jgi:hypothetical protein
MFDSRRKGSNYLTYYTFFFNVVSPFYVRQAIKNPTDGEFHGRIGGKLR